MKTLNSIKLKKLLKRRDVAELLSVSTRTVQRYEEQGLLKPIRLNCRATRYAESDVAALQTPTS